MTAVMATLAGFPAVTSFWYSARLSLLNLQATSAGM
jgi:hypothetical protein